MRVQNATYDSVNTLATLSRKSLVARMLGTIGSWKVALVLVLPMKINPMH